ncbi:MAG: FG-GAP repeat protein [Planctomycetes bacterium]|nr:FG-GAP repeat protein [Planctomycetota bacterium]
MPAPRWVLVPFGLFAPLLVIPILARPLQAQCPLLYLYDGTVQQEYFGTVVAGVGDIDHDGCDDYLISAPGLPIPNTTYYGRVCVYSGATGAVLRCWDGEGGGFGVSAAGAGDVDCDSVPDVLVSAHFYSGPVAFAGRVYVFSGATGQRLWVWDGDRSWGEFGWGVAGPGDLDGDGHADILVGEPGANRISLGYVGRVHAYSGKTGEALWSKVGDYVTDLFGVGVSGAGDFNGDGILDVAAGAPHDKNGLPFVYVLSGPTGEVIRRIDNEGMISDVFGAALAGLGDVNGDGYDDIVVGAYEAGGEYYYSGNGQAYVFCGPDARRLWTWEGELGTSFLGFSVAGPGDVNLDGVPDVLVGAYGYSGYPAYASGKAYVFSGATSEVIFARTGTGYLEGFGESVAGCGDVDADGRPDILIGAKLRPNPGVYAGRAYVFHRLMTGDSDCDADVTLEDHQILSSCWTGVGPRAISASCRGADVDGDWDVDLRDFASFARAFSPP